MDFKSFAKGKGKAKSSNNNGNKSNDDLRKIVEDTVNSRKGKSQEELMSEIIDNAAKQRKEGKLNDADLDNFYNSVAPMLNKEQLARLKNIMKMLK